MLQFQPQGEAIQQAKEKGGSEPPFCWFTG
jgi:hypothetical protein